MCVTPWWAPRLPRFGPARWSPAGRCAGEHTPSRRAVDAERGFLAELGGDCSVPAAAHATLAGDRLRIRGLVASPDGATVVCHELAGPASAGPALGRSVARQLLDDQGGAALLGRT